MSCLSSEKKINTVQHRTPVIKAVAALFTFKLCSNAMAAYPAIKIVAMREIKLRSGEETSFYKGAKIIHYISSV